MGHDDIPHSSDSTPRSDDSAQTPRADQPDEAIPSDQPDFNAEIERLVRDAADLKDKYLRSMAEMENVRRRAEREKADLIKYGLENVFKDLLPVLDSLEKALPEGGAPKPEGGNGGASSAASYLEGMLMVKKQLLDVIRKHGLEPIPAQGAPFDPNLHQAIQRVDSDQVKTETVGSEFARGYMLNGRLLRPAMVSVLTPGG
jgi:molecular chaperone GrpE